LASSSWLISPLSTATANSSLRGCEDMLIRLCLLGDFDKQS
jgi:hypothetical protein